jgi:hypothetical protein
MAICKCKGAALKQTIATVLTAVAQIISLDGPEQEAESFEADTLDNADAGIPYKPTGRTEGGSLSGEMFFDPALLGHQHMLDLLTDPQSEAWTLTFADTAGTIWPFNGAGLSFSPTQALPDGLKASFSIKLDGMVTLPGSGSAA